MLISKESFVEMRTLANHPPARYDDSMFEKQYIKVLYCEHF